MKTRYILGALAGIAILTLAACGGGGDDSSREGIRTQKGLALALTNGNLPAGSESDTSGGRGADEPAGAPVPGDTGVTRDSIGGFGRDGISAPFLQQGGGGTGLTVQGYGSASADADSAIIDFYFGTNQGVIEPVPAPGDGSTGTGNGTTEPDKPAEQPAEVSPIEEADLQAVIDAIVGAGVARGDIEFVGQTYVDRYYASANLRATVKNLDSVNAVVDAATNAAANLDGISMQGNGVSYTVNDCAALQFAALEAAIEDAGDNVATFASALGVTAGAVVGASNFSYFDDTTCGSGYGVYPAKDIALAGNQSASEVTVYANIAVTYALQ